MPQVSIIDNIFNGLEGDIVTYTKYGVERVVELPYEENTDTVAVDLTLVTEQGEVCVGVVVRESDEATFYLSKDGERIGVLLLEDFIPAADVPSEYEINVPTGWTYEDGTEKLYPSSVLSEGVKWNDAIVLGTPSEEFLDAEASFLLGSMYAAGDRRNTLDKGWPLATMPWRRWLEGAAKTREQPAWGLLRHPVAKVKEGPCIVLGSSVEGARKAKAMTDMYALGLDIDSGVTLDSVVQKIQDLGLTAIVYTTFSHGKDGLALKRDDVLKKLKISRDPELHEIQDYLANHSKSRYDPDFITKVGILEQKRQRSTGVEIVLSSPPIEKFRVIFPLKEAVNLVGLAEAQQAALDAWEDAVTGVAVNMLGVTFDTSCTDPSRLFFTPRHPKDGEFKTYLICGELLNFDAIEPFSKAQYARHRDLNNPFAQVGGYEDTHDVFFAFTPSGKSLNEWHKKASTRFQIANLLEDHCSDKIRIAGGEKPGTVHIECPFEHEHSNPGEGTATMAVNALDGEHGRWTVFCRHDACQGKRPLQYLEEMLRSNWFDEDLLTDDLYILPGEDEEEDEDDEQEEVTEEQPPALNFNSQEDIEKYFRRKIRAGADVIVKSQAISEVARASGLTKTDTKRIWDNVARQLTEEANSEEVDLPEGSAPISEWDFMRVCEYVRRRIFDTNAVKPVIFHYMDHLCVITESSSGNARIKFLDKDGFSTHINHIARFSRPRGEGGVIGVSCPNDVRDLLFAEGYGTYPELRGVVTTPAYTRGGHLLIKPGYDPYSKLFYAPDAHTVVPRISPTPSEQEVSEAKRLLVEEVLADFPLGGKTRVEIVEETLHGDGIPAVTNAVALILLPFMRDMIDGPTPGHLLSKPSPGTGASLLTDVVSVIATGKTTPAMAMPASNDEMAKTLTSVLANGQAIVFFDNIAHSVDSGELASAMTATNYQARILGKSQTVEVDVRCTWIFTGNNVMLSSELIRRLMMIDLDARLQNPEKRTGFRHKDIRGWATQNRGKLVWACLTLIQNYITNGMKGCEEEILSSYENWSRTMGGILRDAGLKGFLKNSGELREKAEDDDSDGLENILNFWWEKYGAQEVHLNRIDGDEDTLLGCISPEDFDIPVKRTTMGADSRYSSRSFGKYLSKYLGRVMTMFDGTQVRIVRLKRDKFGNKWMLEPCVSGNGN